jgi:hypothetical protein
MLVPWEKFLTVAAVVGIVEDVVSVEILGL